MKKTMLLVAVLAATLATALAEPNPTRDLYKQHYNYKDFTALTVSHAFRVELTFADAYAVEVEVPAYIEPYLKVSCSAGKLRIGVANLPRDIQRKLNDRSDKLYARVTMPRLLSLSLSGASRLTAAGMPKLRPGDDLDIELSGASQLDAFAANGNGTLSIDLSGASKASIQATFPSLKTSLSGASKLTFTGDADNLRIDYSGAAAGKLTGDYGHVRASLSGSSKIELTGNTRTLELEASGASKYEADGVTEHADIELSGATKCRIAASGRIGYELSGASTLSIKDLGASVSGQCSRGSKVETIR